MTIWIQKYDNEIADDYVFSAYLGFKRKGIYDIKYFHNCEEIRYEKGDIVVGSIGISHYFFKQLGIIPQNFYIPKGLEEFTGRTIKQTTIAEVKKRKLNKETFFIKPVNTKEFPAQVIDWFPLINFMGQNITDDMQCWMSDVVKFVSEYRVFLLKGEIVGCQYYLGDFTIYPDWDVIKDAVSKLEWQPVGWCLDFGIDDNGRTLLIEANDGYSLGDYGLDSSIFSDILKERWLEITKTGF